MSITRGFTLVETLVAIAILTIAITIPYATAEKALVASYVARDQLTASMLAQEGLEYIRDVRDSNYIYTYETGAPVSWLGDMDGTTGSPTFPNVNCFSPNVCTVDTQNKTAALCTSDPDCSNTPLYIENGAYTTRSGGTLSRFARAVQLKTVNGSEIIASSTVSWTTNGVRYHVNTTEYFDNWLK